MAKMEVSLSATEIDKIVAGWVENKYGCCVDDVEFLIRKTSTHVDPPRYGLVGATVTAKPPERGHR
jgi:hypothetical protein